MRTIRIQLQCDKTYAKFMAMKAIGYTNGESLLEEAIVDNALDLSSTRQIKGSTFNTIFPDAKDRKQLRADYKKAIAVEISKLPPYWYTDEQTAEWDEKELWKNNIKK